MTSRRGLMRWSSCTTATVRAYREEFERAGRSPAFGSTRSAAHYVRSNPPMPRRFGAWCEGAGWMYVRWVCR